MSGASANLFRTIFFLFFDIFDHRQHDAWAKEGQVFKKLVDTDAALHLWLEILVDPRVVLAHNNQDENCNNQDGSLLSLVHRGEEAADHQEHSHEHGEVLVDVIECIVRSIDTVL